MDFQPDVRDLESNLKSEICIFIQYIISDLNTGTDSTGSVYCTVYCILALVALIQYFTEMLPCTSGGKNQKANRRVSSIFYGRTILALRGRSCGRHPCSLSQRTVV